MSQLDISIFYSHLFGLLLVFYIFSHFVVLVLVNFYYNTKIRYIELKSSQLEIIEGSNTNIIIKILS